MAAHSGLPSAARDSPDRRPRPRCCSSATSRWNSSGRRASTPCHACRPRRPAPWSTTWTSSPCSSAAPTTTSSSRPGRTTTTSPSSPVSASPCPRIHVPGRQDPQRTVTQDALDAPALLTALSALAAQGCQVTAHGISADERRFTEVTGLPLAGPGPDVCKAVNSKVYSRRVADELGSCASPTAGPARRSTTSPARSPPPPTTAGRGTWSKRRSASPARASRS